MLQYVTSKELCKKVFAFDFLVSCFLPEHRLVLVKKKKKRLIQQMNYSADRLCDTLKLQNNPLPSHIINTVTES